MAILIHGTTRERAERIAAHGPDPARLGSDGFSTYLEGGPFHFGSPEEYACRQAAASPTEGGGAILVMDVPDSIIDLAVSDFFPRSQGLIQFDEDAGLRELVAAWPGILTTIRLVECP